MGKNKWKELADYPDGNESTRKIFKSMAEISGIFEKNNLEWHEVVTLLTGMRANVIHRVIGDEGVEKALALIDRAVEKEKELVRQLDADEKEEREGEG